MEASLQYFCGIIRTTDKSQKVAESKKEETY